MESAVLVQIWQRVWTAFTELLGLVNVPVWVTLMV